LANQYTFVQKLGNTRYCVNVHFAENENAGTYEEKLLNVIQHDADAAQQKIDCGNTGSVSAA